MLPNLEELLRYEHPQVLQSYVRNHLGDAVAAKGLFTEMLKFLWISQKHGLDLKGNPRDEGLKFTFVMHQEMRDIDNMWHNFILHTQDYMDFCGRYFGEYLHHQPDIAIGVIPTAEEFTEQMEKYLSYVYENLGEDTVRTWFADHVSGAA